MKEAETYCKCVKVLLHLTRWRSADLDLFSLITLKNEFPDPIPMISLI
jgi:hypothetical protein